MTPEQEIKLLKELLYCTKRSCNNCGKVNCENFQRQRIDCCGLWVSYKDYITELENKIADIKANCDLAIEGRDVKIKELEKENAELKEKYVKECEDVVYVVTNYNKQLTKATELLKKLILEVRGYEEINGYDTCEPVQEAEQFLNSENIILEDAQAGNSPFDADEVFHKEMKAYPEEK